MLDIRLIREKPDYVRERLATRGGEDAANVDQLLEIDRQRRAGQAKVEEFRAEKKRKSEEVRLLLKSEANPGLLSRAQNTSKGLDIDIATLDRELAELELKQRELLLQIPNLPNPTVPIGDDASANKVVRDWGDKANLTGKVLDHVGLGEKLHLLDLDRATKLSGSGFICFTGRGARLERALIQFMLDLHTREHGYLEISPPFIVRRECMIGTSQLPKFEADMYKLESEDLFLVPTAEVPLTNLYREEIVPMSDLPKKYVGYTPCFRREAGSAGRETRGILRVHQFDKVELMKITNAENSYDELEMLTAEAEKVLQLLAMPYRVIELCTGDLTFGSAKTYDIEVWSPGQQAFLEVSSCSNFEDFQARRMNLRYKDADGKNRFCHTLNGSGLALPRLFAALIENNQRQDGSIGIPEKLQPYFGGSEIR